MKQQQKEVLDNANHYFDTEANLRAEVKSLEESIVNTTNAIGITSNDIAIKTLVSKLEEYTSKKQYLETQLEEITQIHRICDDNLKNIDQIALSLKDISTSIDNTTLAEKKSLLRAIIHKIEWDGENINVYFKYKSPNNRNYSKGGFCT